MLPQSLINLPCVVVAGEFQGDRQVQVANVFNNFQQHHAQFTSIGGAGVMDVEQPGDPGDSTHHVCLTGVRFVGQRGDGEAADICQASRVLGTSHSENSL